MNNKLFFPIIVSLFIVCTQSCTIQRKTIVEIPHVRKIIREKYLVRNDSVFFQKTFGRMICITILDSVKNIFTVQEFHKGKITGEKFVYESNGNLLFYGEFKNGKKNGWHFNFINGRIWVSRLYKNDVEITWGITDYLPEF